MWPFDSEDDADKRRRRQAAREAREAMDMYKRQQADTEKEIGERKAQQAMEKRTIAEKQIRSLRASFRRPSIMAPASQVSGANLGANVGTMQPVEQK